MGKIVRDWMQAQKRNSFYEKEENVRDVLERIDEIEEEFGLQISLPETIDPGGWCGEIVAKCSAETAYGYIVLVKRNLNDSSKTYTSGHENGHFLWYAGQEELIYRKFKNPDKIRSYTNEDSPFAILCGWISMKKAGYYLNDCHIIYSKNPEAEKRSYFIKDLVRDYFQDKN
jgi:hypothetical protein